MSRAEKQRRRLRRKERRNQLARRPPRQELTDALLPEGSVLLSYDITWERLDDSDVDPGLEEIPEDERKALFDDVMEDPGAALPRLTALLERFPDSRTLRNWLTTAHSAAGDNAAAEREARLNYELHPDYLFAKLAWAQFCLQRGEVDEIPRIFGERFDLKLLYPERSVFHITEFLGFSRVMVEYFMRTDRQHQARLLYDAMERMAPEHPLTQQVRGVMSGSLLLRAAKQLSQQLLRWGSLP